MIEFDEYFSNGLKPPTRNRLTLGSVFYSWKEKWQRARIKHNQIDLVCIFVDSCFFWLFEKLGNLLDPRTLWKSSHLKIGPNCPEMKHLATIDFQAYPFILGHLYRFTPLSPRARCRVGRLEITNVVPTPDPSRPIRWPRHRVVRGH